jgi:hypothetical protein
MALLPKLARSAGWLARPRANLELLVLLLRALLSVGQRLLALARPVGRLARLVGWLARPRANLELLALL